MRSFAFYSALVLLFLRFSYLPETVQYFTGMNTYLLYIAGPPALIGVVALRGLERTFRYAPAKFWLAFLVWMVLAVPFSSWIGGSFKLAQTYIRTDFIMLLVAAGWAMTWVECRSMIYDIALATMFNLAIARLLMATQGDRFYLESRGMISDPNDLAAHLLLVLPFLLFVVLGERTPVIIRIILTAALAYGLFLVFRSGSRGGMVALVATLAFVLIFGSARQRAALGIATFAMVIVLIAFLPGSTWKRLTSFSEGSETAIQSAEARRYLLKKSIEITFKKPIFGVGPGQFPNYEGMEAIREGRHGMWHATHNTYTQISSECGIPALVFFLGAIISTFGILKKIRKKAKMAHKHEIVTATFCITLGLIGYSAASIFLSNGYRFPFLAISGLVIAIWRIVSKDRLSPRANSTLTEQTQLEPVEMNSLGA
jgi:putative inorganic carbon (HCO3(-)) transporter